MNCLQAEHYWQNYLQTMPNRGRRDQRYLVDQFGDTPELADELGQLVLSNTKTATCSALWEWEAEKSPLPTVGLKTVVLDGADHPICIIETTEVTILTFNEVDARFAYDEGEGDRTLDSWRREHWKYFSRALPRIRKVPSPDMPLVCERFRVLHRF
ncbi:ASCH domain-containing protein [Oscillatoria sp. CS-180]|uniref:ASCH domain-containing protein n=1 Tax=Oscillatoria sp. CS-180 TaxID=3021720 RepID=UPI00232B5763|nr:ASCH domain-containing protein [Oscillatoria sp. CS-180]MDB9527745.1 ASCH domain-containing protein [Oscillatoria sp. CS-180]